MPRNIIIIITLITLITYVTSLTKLNTIIILGTGLLTFQ